MHSPVCGVNESSEAYPTTRQTSNPQLSQCQVAFLGSIWGAKSKWSGWRRGRRWFALLSHLGVVEVHSRMCLFCFGSNFKTIQVEHATYGPSREDRNNTGDPEWRTNWGGENEKPRMASRSPAAGIRTRFGWLWGGPCVHLVIWLEWVSWRRGNTFPPTFTNSESKSKVDAHLDQCAFNFVLDMALHILLVKNSN